MPTRKQAETTLLAEIGEKSTVAAKAASEKYLAETDGEYESENDAEAGLAASAAAGDEATRLARICYGDDAEIFGFFDAETLMFHAEEITVRGKTVLRAE